MNEEKSISLIIPVFHEQERINRLIDYLTSLPGERAVEIIIVDGAPEQDTIKAIIDQRVIRVASAKGRGIQLNEGFRHASGKYLLFLHADTFPPPAVYTCVRKTLSETNISAGAFTLNFDHANTLLKTIRFMSSIRVAVTRIPYGDQAIFIKTSVFTKIGGYKNYQLFEDIELMERLRRRKHRITILKQKVVTSGRRFRKSGTLRGVLKVILLLILYKAGVHPDTLSKKY
ncbi:MAG: TIGR04283 family arsenosugar biosynthesis glycosyltransferase [Spirochaetaceae bacterium]|nr:TIGR04283 family arsenosugar biosynthesis glycosyltransferase [Spirochaetaceae bacterium]MCF7948482.1 TIGR04283 family arsenosugar biosynthesis glycosyltransferase [Spirochaetia bacterium]MCF7950910.1 TIGR04283 family arsenosugar biosynthesis glycosyltransferase [Spirochaetaceae bacterium]